MQGRTSTADAAAGSEGSGLQQMPASAAADVQGGLHHQHSPAAGAQQRALQKPRSVRDDTWDGQGLTHAIGKTLGVLRQRADEWEAVQAEEQLLREEASEDGEAPGGAVCQGDYYFDEEGDQDDLQELYQLL